MKQKDDQGPELNAPEALPAGKRPKRAPAKPSMRREFMELFRDTRIPPADVVGVRMPPGMAPAARPPSHDTGASAGTPAPDASAPEPSRFLRRFLRQSAPVPELAPSGLPTLDARLGGGFGPGIHVVLGMAGTANTAFLEAVAWEAVGSRRPVLYFAFKTESLRVWERLIATLGSILDGPGIAPAALRGRELMPDDLQTLSRLDSALQTSVLPYISLVDRPTKGRDLSIFLTELLSRAEEVAEQHGRPPLVLIDGLEELLALTGSPPLQVLSRLDETLAADSLPGLLAAGSGGYAQGAGRQLPSSSVLSLEVAAPGSAMLGGHVDLQVQKNSATGWTGEVPLLLDALSGLFAEARPAG
jgi:hypothetical protein